MLYRIFATRSKSPLRSACSSSSFASSIFAFISLIRCISSFSFCHLALNWLLFSFSVASSSRSFASRSFEALSFSRFNACSSISSCITFRSTSSISVGILSISVLNLAAASSITSIALSGKNRSVMYRSASSAAAINAESWIITP